METSGAKAVSLPTETTPPVKIERPTIRISHRTLFFIFLALFILGSAYGYRSLFVAATIDGQPVSRLAVIQRLEKEGGERVLNTIITERLIATAAAQANITITDADIDAALETIKAQVATQGVPFENILAEQGLTLEDVRQQLMTRKQLEKLLGDATVVTDADIDEYLKQAKLSTPKNMSEADFRSKISEQLASQKFGSAADRWITEARQKADIRYSVGYGKAPQTVPAEENPAPSL